MSLELFKHPDGSYTGNWNDLFVGRSVKADEPLLWYVAERLPGNQFNLRAKFLHEDEAVAFAKTLIKPSQPL